MGSYVGHLYLMNAYTILVQKSKSFISVPITNQYLFYRPVTGFWNVGYPNSYLSNFHKCDIVVRRIRYSSTEQFYQVMKVQTICI